MVCGADRESRRAQIAVQPDGPDAAALTPYVIVADDLSGAGDAGVQFAKRGYRTEVLLDPASQPDPDAAVTVYDTDSRMREPAEAAARVKSVLERLRPSARGRLFKKIDSTLRGPMGAEIAATLEALPGAIAFVAPAYPANGRTTRDGVQYVGEAPVHRSAAGSDPRTPVRTPSIPHALGEPTHSIGIDTVRAGIATLRAEIDGAARPGMRFVFDARTDDDLAAIAALLPFYPDAVWVGSAGILGALDPELAPPQPAVALPPIAGPLVAVAGSLNATTADQVECFAQSGAHVTMLEPLDLLADVQPDGVDRELARAAGAYREGRSIALALRTTRGAGERRHAADLARRLGTITARLVAELAPQALFLTGGDTARAVCTALHVDRLDLVDELEPGIPLARGGPFAIVTKAGGFGRPDALVRIDAKLHGELVS